VSAKAEGQGESCDNARVAEREEETNAEWPLPVMEEFAGGAINGGNVINVKGMAHAKAVGEKSGANTNGDSLVG
jgi:hypothetical protein